MVNKKIVIFAVVVLVGAGAYFYYANTLRPLPHVKVGGGELKAPDGFLSYIIHKYGFDKKNGVDIEFVYTDPSENQRLFKDKKVDIAWTPLLTAAKYSLNGMDVVLTGPKLDTFTIYVVAPAAPMQKFEDLKGLRFGSLPVVAAAYSLTALQAKESGFNLAKDFKVTFGTFPELIKLFLNQEVDFTGLNAYDAWKLFSEGKAKAIASLNELWKKSNGRSLPFIALATTKTWVSANPTVAQKVRDSYIVAASYIKSHPEIWQTEKGYFELPITNENLESFKGLFGYETFVTDTNWSKNDLDDIKYLYKRASESGMLPSNFNPDTILAP